MDKISNSGETEKLGGAFQVNSGLVERHLDELVRESVESTLNNLLNAEADELCDSASTSWRELILEDNAWTFLYFEGCTSSQSNRRPR